MGVLCPQLNRRTSQGGTLFGISFALGRRHRSLFSFGEATVKILYLENYAVFAQQVVRQFLSNHQVTVVPSLAAARAALLSNSFDLILSDFDLDDGKGAVFVRECRASHSHVPVIAVSSHEEGNAALVQAGACAVCSKMQFDRIGSVIGALPHEPR